MNTIVYELDTVNATAAKILDLLKYKTVLFKGKMGAGKTTLIKALVKAMGSEDIVSSPTFSLVNEYEGEEGSIYHFDLYRLENSSDAYDIGLDEYLDSGQYCLIEWPERISDILSNEVSLIEIKVLFNGKREVLIS
ncbi:tRNA (adenosine(37)-N6)-threonylcarbamoyltransferase complex ATPase subunit type 1 TsaE [Robertkochia solimangrovi]|uniref:tRNA (adenosine(37)-N6)-threonylcarbamoyltransferase complex ATPase subunit type 1 TsaE n=1 Tax=Robertkochia solimangrovi TaxID=2213046 RepID=UPI00117D3C70|nr:tRNA (adenosine(37)-N6)-threonylcarbamoyltransferase complex ATPase subunit type 1 TsaE [Robertkochia solimangrovi]TRZ45223.1 tRNA (adenosine(37)-N6)-threonylcarbamoyltransferase complex ATPase subunit type 1 TsaE [Robertkochia solimangrovi]